MPISITETYIFKSKKNVNKLIFLICNQKRKGSSYQQMRIDQPKRTSKQMTQCMILQI